ncbi:hypothetical protein EPUS_08762 [Endocarpon pusillum Z07020]|uniref:Ribonuclease H n=1 Tax=Endocarpon pusillum (strain Z07020 / HMAS-L-300199) TaxID=1263415 RepID=U1HSN0_ENDPU|nr:uncharacterized protein EPUS_08762 [Endocarpon pusillum Z07020]ERF73555.1 hypothetical protein EPUS_08762 [Endocarpon pusillum Z07020]
MTAETTRASPSTNSVTSNGTSHKRKRPGDAPKYYAVREGRIPGVYNTWEECLNQIKGHKGALFQSFPSLTDARAFATGQSVSTSISAKNKTGEQRFYAVQIGRNPGVYTDWDTASKQIAGVKRPKHRRFATRAEAEAFVAEGKKGAAAAGIAEAQHADKRMKLVNGAAAPAGLILNDKQKDTQGNIYEPGTGPLPPGAEDGFDPNIKLDINGNLVHKTEAEKSTRKKSPQRRSRCPGDSKNISEALSGTRQTNQRAELTAIMRALDIAPRHRDVTIYTDSRYAIDCVTNWYKNWKRNGWVTTNKKAVENRDLIQEVRSRIEEREGLGRGTYFVWVKGHNGDRGNVEADRLAVEGARLGRGLTAEDVARERADGTGADADAVRDEEEDEEAEAFRVMEEAMAAAENM